MVKAKKARRDKYYKLAKDTGYRARSAFKLIQLNKKYNFLSNTQVLIDLCAAPGGWLQVAAKHMPVSSLIVGVDLAAIKPIPNVITHVSDITSTECRQLLKKDLQKQKADVVLHDGAPNVGAAWVKDAFGQAELVLHALKLATEFLRPGGLFISKVFRSADYHSLLYVFNQLFGRVDATKPHSSRAVSAEIFVVCRDFRAPAKIDPRLLDLRYVFKQVEEPAKAIDIMHKKYDAKHRQRDGYDDSIGIAMHKRMSVADFIEAEDPLEVLTVCNELVFDDRATAYANHASTSPEIKSCCADLKVLGKPDFKLLLKWRMKLLREKHKKASRKTEASPTDESASAAAANVDDETDKLEKQIGDAAQRLLARDKRDKKKEAKQRLKQLKRAALGMNRQNVDVVEDELFSLSQLKGVTTQELDQLCDVHLDSVTAEEVIAENSDDNAAESDDSEEEDYNAKIEAQMNFLYDEYKARKARLEITDPEPSGKKLTRRQRMEIEAKKTEDRALAKLDYEHQKYLRMLAGVSDEVGVKRKRDSEDSASDDDSESSSEESDEEEAPLLVKISPSDQDEQIDPSLRAKRWFSRGIFDEVNAEAQSAALSAAHAPFDSAADSEEDDAASESPRDEKSASECESESSITAFFRAAKEDSAAAPQSAQGAVTQKRKHAAATTHEDSDSEPDIVKMLAALPKSDREKRKERLRKQRDTKKTQAELVAKERSTVEIVPTNESDEDEAAESRPAAVPVDEDDKPLSTAQLKRRALIKAGMGSALSGVEASGEGDDEDKYEVVPAAEDALSVSSGDGLNGEDPRDEEYDSDEHAEILALGKLMKRHTKAKELIDASYNRFAFGDEAGLPEWFVENEHRHFRPQLPVTAAEIQKIKDRFRDIAARPIQKVAEARARKKHRAARKLAQAKKAAANIADTADMSESAKLRAIEKAYKAAEIKRPGAVYVVSRKGGRSETQAKKGQRVKLVDKRMKADKRGMKAAEARKLQRSKKKRRKAS